MMCRGRARLSAGPVREPGSSGSPGRQGSNETCSPLFGSGPRNALGHNLRIRTRVDGWYGQSMRQLDVASGTALWHHPGMQVPIRWVLVRDPEDEKEPQAFLCTDLDTDPVDILRWFVRRWRVEATARYATSGQSEAKLDSLSPPLIQIDDVLP